MSMGGSVKTFTREMPDQETWVIGTENTLYAIGSGEDGLPASASIGKHAQNRIGRRKR